MNEKDSYLKFRNEICKYCNNKNEDLCCIRIRQDNTTYCDGYEKDDEKIQKADKYIKVKSRTACLEKSIMRFWF